MNARFHRSPFASELWTVDGVDDQLLADAGSLVHCFDGWEDHQRMWRSTGDQSASFVSSAAASRGAVIPIFKRGAGLIYRPRVTPLLCGKGGDSGAGHCGDAWCTATAVHSSGIDDDVARLEYPGDGCMHRTWRVRDFAIHLQRQAAWQKLNHRYEHNEIIVDGDTCTARLPWCIGAFFYVVSDSSKDEIRDAQRLARQQQDALLREYPHVSREEIPVVAFDLRNWREPFSKLVLDQDQ